MKSKCLICKKELIEVEFFCKECANANNFPTFDEYLEDVVSKLEKVAYGK